MAKRKRKLKRSVKVFIIIFLLIGIFGTLGVVRYKKINTPVKEPSYGKIGDTDVNEEYGKIDKEEQEAYTEGKPLKYTVFKTKKGESIFIDYGDTEVLIDAGGNEKEGETISKKIREDVKDELDYVIATNQTKERIGGMPKIYENYRVGTTIYSKKTEQNDSDLLSVAEKSKTQEAKNTNLELGAAATLSIYDVSKGATTDKDMSLATVLNYGENKIAYTSDLSEKYEARLVDKIPRVNAIVINKESSMKFAENIERGMIIISSPKKFSKKALKELDEYSDKIYAAYKYGDIVLTCNGREVKSNCDEKEDMGIYE